MPSNAELSLLEKLNWRKADIKLIETIAIDDFSLTKENVRNLISRGFIKNSGERLINKWEDPRQIENGRIWIATKSRLNKNEFGKIMDSLKIQRPSPEVEWILKDKIDEIKPLKDIVSDEVFKKLAPKIREHSKYNIYDDSEVKTLIKDCISDVEKNGTYFHNKPWWGEASRYLLLKNERFGRTIDKILERVHNSKEQYNRNQKIAHKHNVSRMKSYLGKHHPELLQEISDEAFSNITERQQQYLQNGPPEKLNLIYEDALEKYNLSIDKIIEKKFLTDHNFSIKAKITIAQETSAITPRNLEVVYRPKKIDYKVFLKTLRNEPLEKYEARRLIDLRRNGIHPESKEVVYWIKSKNQSWNMEAIRKQEFLNDYEVKYGVNLDALQFVNTYKQVTKEQLLKYTSLSEVELERYAKGPTNADDILGGPILLKRSILPTLEQNKNDSLKKLSENNLHQDQSPLEYYYIAHQGAVSGRGFLKRILPEDSIAKKPQGRRNLLLHDLHVPTCVEEVKKELIKEGYKIKAIVAEFDQFKESKLGVSNENRKGGPAFFDAKIIVERLEYDEQGIASNSKEETIGVEWGDYSVGRLAKKIECAQFDRAFVYSSPNYNQRYIKKFTQYQNVSFRTLK